MKRALIALGLIAVATLPLLVSGPRFASGASMIATWYGEAHRGLPTASGEPFNPDAPTAAHPTLPLGTRLRVSHEGRSVTVRVNDRGPAPWTGADLDLSKAAAEKVGLISEGKGEVSVVSSPTPSDEAPEIVELPRTGGPR